MRVRFGRVVRKIRMGCFPDATSFGGNFYNFLLINVNRLYTVRGLARSDRCVANLDIYC
jgi:hypothetical protein